MSRWLKSVNTLLEQLDGQVETVTTDAPNEGAVESILAQHAMDDEGMESFDSDDYEDEDFQDDEDEEELYSDEDEEDDEAEDEEDEEVEEEIIELTEAEAPATTSHQAIVQPLFAQDPSSDMPATPAKAAPAVEASPAMTTSEDAAAGPKFQDVNDDVIQEAIQEGEVLVPLQSPKPPSSPLTPTPHSASQRSAAGSAKKDRKQQQQQQRELKDKVIPDTPSSPPSAPASANASSIGGSGKSPRSGSASSSSVRELKKAQAELRQLRKHILSLNAKLEASNAEVQAQRDELQRAAERMERDRTRAREEREDLLDDHDEELDQQKEHYEEELEQQKEQYESQIQMLQSRLQQEEQARLQEGGDWTKELQDAIHREREALKQLNKVQTQQQELQKKVSQMERTQATLQSKLDSATQATATATEREREAEDRLDAALSLHSRQLAQRQAREAELEKTVADLGAALTVSRQQKEERKAKAYSNRDEESAAFKEQLELAVEELETVRAQLNLESQRREALQHELNEISKERTEEASAAQAKQRQHDRKVADLTNSISRLQASLSEFKQATRVASSTTTSAAGGDGQVPQANDDLKRQLATLSEQLLRQQGIAEASKAEILTLKSRLEMANSRAEQAEQSAAAHQGSDALMYDMEGGGVGSVGTRMRRRIKGGSRTHRGMGPSSVRSIRSALNLSPGRTAGQGMEQLAITIDAIDSWMVETGAFMRHEPVARLGFFLYFTILHVWSFCLVIFHAVETEHADFGSLSEHGGGLRLAKGGT